MYNKKLIGIVSIIAILLVVGIAKAEFLGNLMRSREEILARAVEQSNKAKDSYVLALKSELEAKKDVAIEKGEKEQKVGFDKQNMDEINRLKSVIDEVNGKISIVEKGDVCFPEGQ